MLSTFDPTWLGLLAARGNSGILIFVAIFGGMLLLVGGIVYLCWRYEVKRTERLHEIANDLGLPFFPKGDHTIIDRLDRMHLFSQGRSKKLKNMLHGESNNVEVAIFDYRYTVGSGKNSNTYHQTVIYFRSPQLKLPQFDLRPEGFWHKIGSAFGYQDIDFASHPQFSRAYLLRGENEANIRAFFDEELLSFFETQKKISVEARGDQLVFYRQQKRIKPDEVQDFLQDGFQVFSMLKDTTEA